MKPKVALAIIAKDEGFSIENIFNKYHKYFDEVHIAYDKKEAKLTNSSRGYIPREKIKFHKYEWKNDFADKRNFLADKCSEAGMDYYFTIDTDDIILNPENLPKLFDKAHSLGMTLIYLPYIYAKDHDGNIKAKHNKERLVACNGNYYWNKKIHENILAKDQKKHKFAIDNTVTIDHNVSPEHADESYERNMIYLIDEYNEDKENCDPRTLAYLGRCASAIGNWDVAIFFLQKHIEKCGWDEDKYMSLCQLSDVLRTQEKYELAVGAALEAIALLPDWPDAYLCMHDIETYRKDYKKAIEWAKQALQKKRPETFIMDDPSKFGWRLSASLSYCYMQIDDIDRAYRAFKMAEKDSPNSEFIKANKQLIEKAMIEKTFLERFTDLYSMVKELDKDKVPTLVESIPDCLETNEHIAAIKSRYRKPKVWEDNSVVMFCGRTLEPFYPGSIKTGIGGSEEAVIHMSNELTKLGYKVTVYNICDEWEGTYDGVEYKSIFKFNPKDHFNIFISWRQNIFQNFHLNCKQRVVWLHDIYYEGQLESTNTYDTVFVLSEYHKSLLPDCVPEEKIVVTSNGLNYADFSHIKHDHDNHKVIYASSYDRGLEHLLRRWNEVISVIPDAELHIYYGWDNYEKLLDSGLAHRDFYDEMKELMNQPGVYEHGRIGQQELHQKFAESKVWCYPSHFEEISCITAMKAQVCGAIPVCTDYAALQETVKQGILTAGNARDKAVMDALIENLIDTLKEPYGAWECDYDFSWSKVAGQWLNVFSSFTFKPYDYKDLEDYKKKYDNAGNNDLTTVDKGVAPHRYFYALDVVKHLNTVLDIGTFDGAFPVYACEYLGLKSTGIDINTKFIAVGQKIVKDKELDCTLIGGTTFEEFETEDKYDAITIMEVIEHVLDPSEIFKKAHSLLNEGGILVISTPEIDGEHGSRNHDPYHVRYYSIESLTKELEPYFEVIHSEVECELIQLTAKKRSL